MTKETTPREIQADAQSDYDRVARAIEFIRSHAGEQPSLDKIARAVNLSEWHLQKLFSRWAGVSPKRFLQCLTLSHAQERLRQSSDILGTSLEVGLSGPGRLHDLFVTLEAVSPGDFKRGGATLEIQYGFYETPLGFCGIAKTARGVCRLEFLEKGDEAAFEHRLRAAWPEATHTRDPECIEELAQRIFVRKARQTESLHALVRGTNFQIQVWRALLRIPSGHLISYGRLAAWIGAPKAQRAVGTAVGDNPIAYLIPCHRVLRASGDLGGYRWGENRKAACLVRENPDTPTEPSLA